VSAALIAEGVTKRYGRLTVVADASLRLEPGTLTALLGPSGAGKSTLLRILAGLEPLDAGEVRIGANVLSSPRVMVPAEQRRTGLIFQDYALFPHMTALENVLFGLSGRPKPESRRLASDWLARLSLAARADAYPHQLSGGEQQRVAIARALAPAPDAILMDEPFSGLDPALEAGVRQAALRALADAGKPALLVTHDPSAAMAMADRLAVMRAGRILQVGTPEEVYAAPADLGVARALGPLQAVAPAACPPELLEGLDLPAGPVVLGLREEAVRLEAGGPARARVERVAFLGPLRRIALRLEGPGGPLHLMALIPAGNPAPAMGEEVAVRLAPQGRFIFPVPDREPEA